MATGMFGWIEDHPDIALGGGVVAVLLIAGSMFKAKTPTTGTATQDLSGLTNGIVYVPTQTSFTTNNRTQSGVFASNDPLLTGITTGPVNSPTTTTNKGVPIPQPAPYPGPIPVPSPGPPRQPPPPKPNPPPTTKRLIWDQSYTIVGGDNLSAIAARLTPKLRAQGMPGSMSIAWTDLWQHNQGVVTKYANMHGHYTNVQDWVFPGETITVPRWG